MHKAYCEASDIFGGAYFFSFHRTVVSSFAYLTEPFTHSKLALAPDIASKMSTTPMPFIIFVLGKKSLSRPVEIPAAIKRWECGWQTFI